MDGGRAENILARTTAAALAVSSADGATLFQDLARRLAGAEERAEERS